MARNTLTERVTRLEEQGKYGDENFRKQVKQCMKLFEKMSKHLGVLNREQGETRDAIKDLESLINQKVSSPMSGREKATIYVALTTGISGIIIALISVLV